MLGDRATWRRMPKGVLARLKLLLFGFPAVPHQRPRHALTQLQQQQAQQEQQQQQHQDPLVPAAATAAGADSTAAPPSQVAAGDSTAAAASSSSGGAGHRQWRPQAELAVESTRPVALSLQEQWHTQPSQQQQQPAGSPAPELQQQQQSIVVGASAQQLEPCSCGSCDQSSAAEASSNGVGSSAQHSTQQLPCVQPADCSLQEVRRPDGGAGAAGMAAHGSNGSSNSSSSNTGNRVDGQEAREQIGSGPCSIAGPAERQQPEEQLQWQVLPQQQRLQEQLGQIEQAAVMEALLDYGRWSVRGPQQASSSAPHVRELVQATASSSSGITGSASAFVGSSSGSSVGSSSSNVLSAAMLGAPSALQLVLQQQQAQMLLKTAGCAAVVMATANAVVDASSSTAGRCQ